MSNRQRIAREVAADLLFVGSGGLLSYAGWIVHPSAGFAVAGIAVLLASLAVSPGKGD